MGDTMKTLKQYLKIKDKKDRLIEFLQDNEDWQNNYIDDCPDFKDNYFDLIDIGTIYYDELEDDIKNLLIKEIEKKGINFLFDNNLVDCNIHYGISRCSDELWSFNIGEVEVQFTGLYDHDSKVNCIYSELVKGMGEEEIKEAIKESGLCVYNDCIYIDRSYDRVSFTLKVDLFLNYTNS